LGQDGCKCKQIIAEKFPRARDRKGSHRFHGEEKPRKRARLTAARDGAAYRCLVRQRLSAFAADRAQLLEWPTAVAFSTAKPVRSRECGPLKVLITVDTEVWPYRRDWREERLHEDIRRDIYGATQDGEFGLEFQCALLRDHGLKAVFFVETLFASVVGLDPLRQIVETIRKYDGQTAELHAHPEWTRYFPAPALPAGRTFQHFHQLTLEQQSALLGLAHRNLQDSGVTHVRAFRAGNYGANLDTCRALAALGIPFDFSYDAAFPGGCCKIPATEPLFQPAALCGVTEIPTSFFEDYPGHLRHVQICACSFAEMRHALEQAWRAGWRYFVILLHSFELIRRERRSECRGRLNPIPLHRMERLCRFLSQENDRFETIACQSLEGSEMAAADAGSRLRGSWWNTAARYAEQAFTRLS
jgi:peptidoglycan/xylan/chitin deacetylase (PgdA/CDA1 family)